MPGRLRRRRIVYILPVQPIKKEPVGLFFVGCRQDESQRFLGHEKGGSRLSRQQFLGVRLPLTIVYFLSQPAPSTSSAGP